MARKRLPEWVLVPNAWGITVWRDKETNALQCAHFTADLCCVRPNAPCPMAQAGQCPHGRDE